MNYLKNLIRRAHFRHVRDQEVDLCKKISPESKVLSGPFEGMQYPQLVSFGSSLFPKLLGSYEDELHPFINSIKKNHYNSIIDVGCAEGYYAVGMARLFPATTVVAFDTNENAVSFCKKMAEFNRISNVKYESLCSASTLRNFDFKDKGLIISDCEGYEDTLFDKENIINLGHCDLIIELHDLIVPGIKEKLLELFEKTHDAAIVLSKLKSISDYAPLKQLNFRKYTDMILYERNTRMEWLVLTAKAV